MRYLFVILLIMGGMFAIGAVPDPFVNQGPGPCNAGKGQSHSDCTAQTAPPTQAPANNQPCVYTPPPTVPFASSIAQNGVTQLGNNTCIPQHQYTEVTLSGGGDGCADVMHCSSPAPYLNQYVDFGLDKATSRSEER